MQLPLKAAEEIHPERLPSREDRPLDLTGVHVLLVEDEASAREGTRALLEANGAQVQAVESADAAKDVFSVQRPSVLISDIGLPGEDGYTLIQQLRALERQQGGVHIPAMALTAFARQEDRQPAFDAGYDAHVTKPVDPDELLLEVARLVRRRGARPNPEVRPG